MITMEELLALMVRQGGSDLHLSVASPPRIRVDGLLLPVETALDDIPALAITEEESFQLKLGRPIVLLPRQAQELKAQRRPREIAGKDCTFTALALCDGVAVALGDARAGKFQPSRVFNLTP